MSPTIKPYWSDDRYGIIYFSAGRVFLKEVSPLLLAPALEQVLQTFLPFACSSC